MMVAPASPQIALRIAPSLDRAKVPDALGFPSTRAFLCRLTPKRNSLAACASDHSRSSPRSRNCLNPRPSGRIPAPQFASAKRSAADPAWSVTSVGSGHLGADGWLCDLGARVEPGRGGSAPARHGSTGIKIVDSRSNSSSRILPWRLHRGWSRPHSLLLIHRRHDHLVSAVHDRTVVRLQEVLSSRCGDDTRLGIGEHAGTVVGHHATTFGQGLIWHAPRLPRRHGFPYLLQPTLLANSSGNSSPAGGALP